MIGASQAGSAEQGTFMATTTVTPWHHRHTTQVALLVLLATLWGASYTFIRIGVVTIPPVTLIAARTLIAGGILLGVLRWRGIALPRERASWRAFLLQACLNSVVPFTLIAWAERTVGAGLATILNSTSPIFVFVLGAALTPRPTTTARKSLGVALGLVGTLLVIGPVALEGFGHQVVAQMALVLAAACYAGAALFGRTFKGLDPMVPAAGSLLCGSALLIPVSLVLDRPWTLAPSIGSMLALGALSVLSTALALTIYFRLLQSLGPLATASQAYLRVPVGVLIGVLFLGETLAPTAWAGLACIVVGVVAMTVSTPSTPSASVSQNL